MTEEELKRVIIWLCEIGLEDAVKLLIFTGYQSRKGLDGKTFIGQEKQEFEWLRQNASPPEIQDEVHQKTPSGVKTNSLEAFIRLDN